MINTDFIFIGILTFSLSAAITRLMVWIGIQDDPTHRSSHSTRTPRSGGVSMVASFLFCMIYFFWGGYFSHIPEWRLVLMLLAAVLIVMASLKDDITGISFRRKLAMQVLGAVVVVTGGLSFDTLPLPYVGVWYLGGLGGVLSLFWIVGFMNAFNFMDGLDGLAAGTSIVASFFSAIIALMLGEKAIFFISFTLFWATMGFFIFNFPPARIFMGDVGSQFLGFTWSIIFILAAQASHNSISVYTVPLLFFSFIYDVVLTLLRRISLRQTIWYPHRTFLFHILNRSGYTHRQISLVYMGFAVLQGFGAILLQHITPSGQIYIFIPYSILMVLYTRWVKNNAAKYIKREI